MDSGRGLPIRFSFNFDDLLKRYLFQGFSEAKLGYLLGYLWDTFGIRMEYPMGYLWVSFPGQTPRTESPGQSPRAESAARVPGQSPQPESPAKVPGQSPHTTLTLVTLTLTLTRGTQKYPRDIPEASQRYPRSIPEASQ